MSKDWIDNITSAWKGHRNFAETIVKFYDNPVVVELGVDYGYSTFSFSNGLKDLPGMVYGIDWFHGDHHTGSRDTYNFVVDNIRKHNLKNIQIIKGKFEDECKTWDKQIDILHIDGFHTYEAVRQDFENWHPFLKHDGVVLFHDTAIKHFGIKPFFDSLHDGYKLNFTHSAGLGIYTKNKKLYDFILENFDVR